MEELIKNIKKDIKDKNSLLLKLNKFKELSFKEKMETLVLVRETKWENINEREIIKESLLLMTDKLNSFKIDVGLSTISLTSKKLNIIISISMVSSEINIKPIYIPNVSNFQTKFNSQERRLYECFLIYSENKTINNLTNLVKEDYLFKKGHLKGEIIKNIAIAKLCLTFLNQNKLKELKENFKIMKNNFKNNKEKNIKSRVIQKEEIDNFNRSVKEIKELLNILEEMGYILKIETCQ